MTRQHPVPALPPHAAEVLALFAEAECPDSLFWLIRDGEVVFMAMCSDTFHWASADAELIEPGDMDLLRSCADDLGDADAHWLAELFAARKRGMRPMRLRLYGRPGAGGGLPQPTLALFEAAGPERDPASEG